MIPNWIELECVQRGRRMVNLDAVSNFYRLTGASQQHVMTVIITIEGEKIVVKDDYDRLAECIQKRKDAMFKWLDDTLDAIGLIST